VRGADGDFLCVSFYVLVRFYNTAVPYKFNPFSAALENHDTASDQIAISDKEKETNDT
jgi:hypothetical protein